MDGVPDGVVVGRVKRARSMGRFVNSSERAGISPLVPSELLEVAHLESLAQLSRIIELRDDATGEHTARVARLSGMIAQNLRLPSEQIRRVHRVAPVHDIGKVVVPDQILLKPGPLTAQEQALMRRHTTLASEIMGGSTSEIIRLAEQVARHHHERWDGHGYPDGLAGEEIPLAARIVAVADAFDAMVNERPYRSAVPIAEVLEVLDQESGWQFDPDVVAALFKVIDERKTARLSRLAAGVS